MQYEFGRLNAELLEWQERRYKLMTLSAASVAEIISLGQGFLRFHATVPHCEVPVGAAGFLPSAPQVTRRRRPALARERVTCARV
jgi:hypothetical protein